MHIVAQKFGIEPLIRLQQSVTSAVFNETKGNWKIKVEDSQGSEVESEVDIYVHATGVLSQVNRPNIAGLQSFTANPILHTAEFPLDLDWKTAFKDERVAVIGIGSSGLQTVGAIAPFCKSVDVFARSKFWVRRLYFLFAFTFL